jgi:hypothetical protein
MSNRTDPVPLGSQPEADLWFRCFGNRGLVQLIIGTDTESMLVLIPMISVALVVVWHRYFEVLGSFMSLLMLAVVLYFFRNVVTALVGLVETLKVKRER